MMRHHRDSWEKMKEDTSLYRLPGMNLYYTKAVYDFIWNSEEDYGDTQVALQGKSIRRLLWELPFYLVVLAAIIDALIRSGVLG